MGAFHKDQVNINASMRSGPAALTFVPGYPHMLSRCEGAAWHSIHHASELKLDFQLCIFIVQLTLACMKETPPIYN